MFRCNAREPKHKTQHDTLKTICFNVAWFRGRSEAQSAHTCFGAAARCCHAGGRRDNTMLSRPGLRDNITGDSVTTEHCHAQDRVTTGCCHARAGVLSRSGPGCWCRGEPKLRLASSRLGAPRGSETNGFEFTARGAEGSRN